MWFRHCHDMFRAKHAPKYCEGKHAPGLQIKNVLTFTNCPLFSPFLFWNELMGHHPIEASTCIGKYYYNNRLIDWQSGNIGKHN